MAFGPMEIEAIEKILPTMGEYVSVSQIGGKAFNDCSRDEILGLFAHTVKAFRSSLQEVIGDDVPF